MSKLYTAEDVRRTLNRELYTKSQTEIAREVGVKVQNVSVMAAGSPIIGKVLAWLGYERVTMYRRLSKEPK